MSGWNISAVTLALSICVSCAGPVTSDPSRATEAALGHCSLSNGSRVTCTNAERSGFQRHFDAAACQCQARLLGNWQWNEAGDAVEHLPYFIGPGDVAVGADSELSRFADSDLGTDAHCSELDWRPVNALSDVHVNGCAPTSKLSGAVNVTDGELAPLAHGFCRADFNRCLAAEIERRSESLAAAPGSRAVRDALREESRLRLQSGALEMASALGAYADGCGVSGWASSADLSVPTAVRRDKECVQRLEAGYATHAVSHLASMSMRLADLLELEAHAAAQASDALSPGMASSSQAYVDALWGSGGIRMAVAESLMGRMEADVGYARSEAGVAPDANSLVYADRVERDERVALAMQLMIAHQAPFNASVDRPGRITFHPLNAIPGGAAGERAT